MFEYSPRERELPETGRIKPDELKNGVHGICADECSDDEVMIPKLEERDEVENSDAVDTRSDQSGSHEKKLQTRLPHQPRPFRGLTIFLHIFFDL